MDVTKRELTMTDDLQVLFDALCHEDEEYRLIAARQLGFFRNPSGVPSLISHILDESQNVRSEIIRALDRLGAPAEIALLNVLNKNPNPAWYAAVIEALGHFRTKAAIEALCNAIKSEYPSVRCAAIRSLEKIGIVNPEIENALFKCLDDPDRDVVKTSIHAIGSLGCDRAVPPLLELIDNSDEGVRYNSVVALGKMRSVHAVNPLIRLIQSSENDYFKDQILDALGNIRDPLAIKPLIEMLIEESNNPMGRSRGSFRKTTYLRRALTAIGESAVQPLIDTVLIESRKLPKQDLRDMYSYGDFPLLSDIRYILKPIGSPAVEPLIDLLKNTDWLVRRFACRTLGGISDNRSINPLITTVINDSSREVRDAAGRSLQNFPAVLVFDPLLGEIQKGNAPDLDEAKWAIECIARDSLGRLGDSLFSDDAAKRSATDAIYRNVITCSAAISEEEDDEDTSFYGRRAGMRRMRRCRYPA